MRSRPRYAGCATRRPARSVAGMRAVTYDKPGDPTVLYVQELPDLAPPGPGEVLIEVTATAVNRAAGGPAGANPTSGTPADAEPSRPSSPTLDAALDLVVETVEALAEERPDDEHIWGSMVKQALTRRHPGFNERSHGFRSFNELLLEAQRRSLVRLFIDEKKSGAYRVLPVE